MIAHYPNFLNNDECEYFIHLFEDGNSTYYIDKVLKFYHIDLLGKGLATEKFSKFVFKKLWVQMYDESIDQFTNFHRHFNPWSFVIFLNENFSGGELVFSEIEYKPKTGDMIYFSPDEYHKVNNCIGNRYTLVGFMYNNPMNIKKNNLI
jgi:hypothetical protein